MISVIALEYIPKETIDNYASIESTQFGQVLLEALGITGACTLFRKSTKQPDCYLIGWWMDDGSEQFELFSYERIKRYLKWKKLRLTTDVSLID